MWYIFCTKYFPTLFQPSTLKKVVFKNRGLAYQVPPSMVNLYGLMDDNRMVNHALIFQK
jgi:hypothetical protein